MDQDGQGIRANEDIRWVEHAQRDTVWEWRIIPRNDCFLQSEACKINSLRDLLTAVLKDINRLILAEGSGDQVPKVEFGGGGQDDSKDPFEDSLEDALCVFKSGAGAGKDTDILKENEAQLLFYIDLDNETVIDKSDAANKEGG